MASERGVALILALLLLGFLTVLGGALLTTSTIDVRISDNYKTDVRNLYAAEAGIEQARELIRASDSSPTQLLARAAGPDGVLSTSDDIPLIREAQYQVWMRNDNGDGMSSTTDRNQILNLWSVSTIGNLQKTIQATIRKTGFSFDDPALNSAAGREGIARRITAGATDVYNPAPGTAQAIDNYGSPGDYRVAVVNGDVNLGSGTDYGILLARGDVEVTGNFTWYGLVLVIGPGTLHWNSHSGAINGGLFVNGTPDVTINVTDPAQVAAANKRFPYVPIAIRER